MAEHNRRFAHTAASDADYHCKRPSKKALDEAFQLEQQRVLSADWVVSYQGRLLQLERQSRHHAPASSRVTVRENQRGQISIEYRGHKLGFNQITQRPPRETTPAKNHPWKQSYKQMRTPFIAACQLKPRGHF